MNRFPTLSRQRRPRLVGQLLLLLIVLMLVSACGMRRFQRNAPPPTPTPPATPLPTATPTPASASATAGAAAVNPTPQVTIPEDFTVVTDERLGYSFAVPDSWTELDLRSTQIQRLAGFIGLGEQLAPLNTFLESPEGQVVGKIYITDITSAMFGGLPSLLNVSVFPAPDLTAEEVAAYVQAQIDANVTALSGNATVSPVTATTINNLPALASDATVDLTAVGMDAQAYARVVALLANDQVYLLTTLVPAAQREDKAAQIEQIIGTFRPE
ncbi:MAG: hypothetical protein KDE19_09395 [Caldilineaceae bacterium]|nr:hypothetical protein [Caldilineaceae bacterium]